MQDKSKKNIQISEISQRIAKLIEFLGINSKEFAKQIGIGEGRLSNALTGRNKPDTDFVSRIAKKFRNVNCFWLLTGEGEIEILYNSINVSPALAAEPTLAYDNSDLKNELIEVMRENRILRKRVEELEKNPFKELSQEKSYK